MLRPVGAIAGALLLLLAVAVRAQKQPTTVDDSFTPYEGQLNDKFDWELCKAYSLSHNGNLVISPISVKLLLAMLYEGSAGFTAKELETVLDLPVSRIATRDVFKSVLQSLQTPNSEYILNAGSRVYLDSALTPVQRYASVIKEHYFTDVTPVNFTDAQNAKMVINEWVRAMTNNRIQNLVDEDDIQDSVLLLTNAIYFKGQWKRKFPHNRTAESGFYVSPQQTVHATYMTNTAKYYYLDSQELDAKMIRIPYKGGLFSMFILLPNSKGGLPQLLGELSATTISRQLWLMEKQEVEVTIPKFKFDFSGRFGPTLKKLGLQQLFQNTASLPGIARGKGILRMLVLKDVVQKAGIEVNEEGSEIYAATEVQLGNKFGGPDLVFNATHPFMFFVQDERSGTTLFMGKVENPLQTSTVADAKVEEVLDAQEDVAVTEQPTTACCPESTTATTKGRL